MTEQVNHFNIDFDGSNLSGWSYDLADGIIIINGKITTSQSVLHNLKDPIPGLVLFIPVVGETQVSLAQSTEIYTISPGNAYFYSADAGPYLARFGSSGIFSGLKIFFSVDRYHHPVKKELSIFRLYEQNISRPIFEQLQIDQALCQQVANLSSKAETDLLQLDPEITSLIDQILSLFLQISLSAKISYADDQIMAADHILKQHIEFPPSVHNLANAVGLNHMALKRGFKRIFKTTVYGRLRHYRIQAAKEFIQQGKSVTDAALSVGYSNPSKFTAVFKKEMGILPSSLKASL